MKNVFIDKKQLSERTDLCSGWLLMRVAWNSCMYMELHALPDGIDECGGRKKRKPCIFGSLWERKGRPLGRFGSYSVRLQNSGAVWNTNHNIRVLWLAPCSRDSKPPNFSKAILDLSEFLGARVFFDRVPRALSFEHAGCVERYRLRTHLLHFLKGLRESIWDLDGGRGVVPGSDGVWLGQSCRRYC